MSLAGFAFVRRVVVLEQMCCLNQLKLINYYICYGVGKVEFYLSMVYFANVGVLTNKLWTDLVDLKVKFL